MDSFRQRVRARQPVLGTFIKTASHQVVEVLGIGGLDFAIVDAEHAPFGLATLDVMALAGRAAGLPLLVRVPALSTVSIGQMLDLGAGGVVVPHVFTAEAGQAAVAAAKYSAGKRGFSPSTRAGGYGSVDGKTYRAQADAGSSVWCQIEDKAALANLDAIAQIDEIDCLFIGRADLSLSLGVDGQKHPDVVSAVKATADAGKRQNRTVGIHISDTAEIPELLALGITAFVYSTDQGLLSSSVRRLRTDLATMTART
jgi:2-keto-3-deoxy-L-rhamnonate aldolase RhmA